tara:strand:+ start:627 stop:899 length:273 start_codon:yes stop_codon:yes gene_type:complete
MWLITAVFLTSLGTLNSSVAEDTFFPTHEACRTHYVKHKDFIKKSIHSAISAYVKKNNPTMEYQIQWVGCMHWDEKINPPKPRPKLKVSN